MGANNSSAVKLFTDGAGFSSKQSRKIYGLHSTVH